LLKKLNSQWP